MLVETIRTTKNELVGKLDNNIENIQFENKIGKGEIKQGNNRNNKHMGMERRGKSWTRETTEMKVYRMGNYR